MSRSEECIREAVGVCRMRQVFLLSKSEGLRFPNPPSRYAIMKDLESHGRDLVQEHEVLPSGGPYFGILLHRSFSSRGIVVSAFQVICWLAFSARLYTVHLTGYILYLKHQLSMFLRL